jgi:hypothetical protein
MSLKLQKASSYKVLQIYTSLCYFLEEHIHQERLILAAEANSPKSLCFERSELCFIQIPHMLHKLVTVLDSHYKSKD